MSFPQSGGSECIPSAGLTGSEPAARGLRSAIESRCARAPVGGQANHQPSHPYEAVVHHHLNADDVLDAVVCVEGLPYVWDDDPERGRRALVGIQIGRETVVVVLYPVADHSGDIYALGSAYPRRRGTTGA